MTRMLRRLRSDRKGASALEFALVLPVLILFIMGIAQMGMLYFSHAGLRNLVAEGARLAAIAPRPTDAAIKARLNQGGFGLKRAKLKAPVVTYGEEADGTDWAQISMSYSVDVDLIFYKIGPFDIEESRRVFIYPAS